jgi:small subunit ribosomal protein S10
MEALSKEHNITLGGVIPLPTKKTRITLLRSPHVNKQSREQFETRRHSRLLKIKAYNQDTVIAFLKEVEDTCPVGVTIRATLGFMKKEDA